MAVFSRKSFNKVLSTVLFFIVISACHFSFKAKEVTSEEKIKIAYKKAINFLQQVQRRDGAICDTINPLFETWETILAATAIYRAHPDTNNTILKKAFSYLYSNENNEGLICHNQKCKNSYCLETTAVYYDLLKLTGKNNKEGLKHIISLQDISGQWQIGNPDVQERKDFPSVTGFVLGMLAYTSVEPIYKKEAIEWILNKQTQEGDWGIAWEYYGCPAYALWPLMKVLDNENSIAAKTAKEKSIAYIYSNQKSDGSWLYRDSLLQKQTSTELQTALMLASLQHAGLKNIPAVTKGIDFLLNCQQEKGNWNGGYFTIPEKRYNKQEYIFATALTAEVLHNYLHNMQM